MVEKDSNSDFDSWPSSFWWGVVSIQCKLALLLCWNFFFSVTIHFFFLVLSTLLFLFLFLLSPISSLLYFLILSTSFIPSHLTLFPFISHSLGSLFIPFIFPHHPAHSFTFLFSLLLSTPSYPSPSLVLLPTLPHPLSPPSLPSFLPSLPFSLPPSFLFLHTLPFFSSSLPIYSYTLPPFVSSSLSPSLLSPYPSLRPLFFLHPTSLPFFHTPFPSSLPPSLPPFFHTPFPSSSLSPSLPPSLPFFHTPFPSSSLPPFFPYPPSPPPPSLPFFHAPLYLLLPLSLSFPLSSLPYLLPPNIDNTL